MKGKIFNAQEVQAIIAGNKTMFREVVKTCKQHPNNVCRKVRNAHYGLNLKEDGLFWQPYGGSELQPFPYCDGKLSASTSLDEFCPYQVGETIFVKESFSKLLIHSGHQYYYPAHCIRECVDRDNGFHYWADGNPEFGDWESPRPATHMKQEQSRITLEITSIRVERLGGDICEENLPQGFRQIKDRNHFMYDTHIKRIPCNCGNSSPTLLSSVNIRTFLKESAYKFMCPECKKTPNETYITSNGASCDWNDLIDPSWREKSESTHKKPEEKWEANPWVWVVDFKINK